MNSVAVLLRITSIYYVCVYMYVKQIRVKHSHISG